jgi:tetraacyldisaccharide 4'-kinase
LHPGVISRGYGAGAVPGRPGQPRGGGSQVGDEPLLIAQRTGVPLVVGRRCRRGAQPAGGAPEVDVIISDDGLQHYAGARYRDRALRCRGVGNGWLLPAGPCASRPRRRDFSVLNVGLQGKAPAGACHAPAGRRGRATGAAGARKPLTMGEGGVRLAAVAGIGNPERFFATRRGPAWLARHPLPDHYDFAIDPFAGLAADVILITEKDAVKCRAIEAIRNDPRIWVVPNSAHPARWLNI